MSKILGQNSLCLCIAVFVIVLGLLRSLTVFSRRPRGKGDFVIILTATIHANQTDFRRLNAKQRFDDYLTSLRFWCEKGFPIILVENSQATQETEWLRKSCPSLVEVILVNPPLFSKDTNYGKLEALSIRGALNKTKHQAPGTYFIKVTGRIRIPNFEQILATLECKRHSPGCPSAFLNPYVLPPPHSQRPFIDTTFMIFTKMIYNDILSSQAVLPHAIGLPIERTLADYILTTCQSGFDPGLLMSRCGIKFLRCVKRIGIVGWSGVKYQDDADCLWVDDKGRKSESAQHSNSIPPVIFVNYTLLEREPILNSNFAILGYFEGVEPHNEPTIGMKRFLDSHKRFNQGGDVFIFSRIEKYSHSMSELLEQERNRYILFSPVSVEMAPPRFSAQWFEFLIGSGPKIFFLRFVLYQFVIHNFLSRKFEYFLLTDTNDVMFQQPVHAILPSTNFFGVIPAFEFTKWDHNSTSGKINRMWLVGCKQSFDKNVRKMPDYMKETLKILDKHLRQSVPKCSRGNEWESCTPNVLQEKFRYESVSCAGTLVGRRQEIMEYLQFYRDMHTYGFFCNDQGLHNIILNTFLKPNKVEVSHSKILTMDSLNQSEVQFSKGVVRNGTQAFSIIHQYNRCPSCQIF